MYILQLVQRFESFHVELYDRHLKTRTKISLGYTSLHDANEIYERIPTFESPRLWKVLTSNYGQYATQPQVIHAQRDITLPENQHEPHTQTPPDPQ